MPLLLLTSGLPCVPELRPIEQPVVVKAPPVPFGQIALALGEVVIAVSMIPPTVTLGLPLRPPDVPVVFRASVLEKVGVPVKPGLPLRVGLPVKVPERAAPLMVVEDSALTVIEGVPNNPEKEAVP